MEYKTPFILIDPNDNQHIIFGLSSQAPYFTTNDILYYGYIEDAIALGLYYIDTKGNYHTTDSWRSQIQLFATHGLKEKTLESVFYHLPLERLISKRAYGLTWSH